uniref:Roundabout guidance receptor 1 n=1 Tax=Maylandia zebra TaxID=106582 RepID=A0A3P9BY80_9CICH
GMMLHINSERKTDRHKGNNSFTFPFFFLAGSDHPPPVIRQGPVNQTVSVDSTVTLGCQSVGTPTPAIHWKKDETGLLKIHYAKLGDTGFYTCVASNSNGEASRTAYLQVEEFGVVVHAPSKPEVTDISRTSVTVSWKSGPSGTAPPTSYLIEAFSYTLGSRWVTLAEHVKAQTFVLRNLKPGTVYLFMVRAVNSYGLSDPSPISDSIRTQDSTATMQGVDHRHIQRELADVVIHLRTPTVLSSSAVRVQWTVEQQSPYIQGYKFSTGRLLSMLRAPLEDGVVISQLKKGSIYEFKVRPFFDEFQGTDSEVKVVRTLEEAPSRAPQGVTVTKTEANGTAILVSWKPPPNAEEAGLIQEYKIWCLGNESRYHVNQSVDGSTFSVLISSLAPGIRYSVVVAASNGAGPGVQSDVAFFQLDSAGQMMDISEERDTLSQISDVVKQPAFIAGIGATCWLVLMIFSVWLYRHRKKRSGLSSTYTGIRKGVLNVFLFLFAVAYQRGESVCSAGRPGLLSMGEPLNQLWLPDSWPNACANHKDCSINCCNNGNGTSDSNMTTYSRPADCIANYGNHPENKQEGQLGSETAIYTDVNLSNKLNEIKTFNNSNLCYASPGGDSAATYEPIPYATTQLIQASIKNKAASGGSIAEPLDIPCWKQPPNLPPIPKEMAAQMQYNLTEQKSNDHLQGGEGMIHPKAIPYNQTRDHSTGGSHHSSDRGSNSTSGSQNQKKGIRVPKIPKHNAVSWGEALSPPHANAWDCDEYSLPMERSFNPEERTEGCPTPPVRGPVSSSTEVSYNHPPITPSQGDLTNEFDRFLNSFYSQHVTSNPRPLSPTHTYSSIPLCVGTDGQEENDEDLEEETDTELTESHYSQDHNHEKHKHQLHHQSPHKQLLHGLDQTPASSTGDLDRSVTGSMVNSWGSASEDNISSGRSSVVSTSEGSFFTDGDFNQAVASSRDIVGLRMCRYQRSQVRKHMGKFGDILLYSRPSFPSGQTQTVPNESNSSKFASSGDSRTKQGGQVAPLGQVEEVHENV